MIPPPARRAQLLNDKMRTYLLALGMLLAKFGDDGPIPARQVDVYRELTDRLCHEFENFKFQGEILTRDYPDYFSPGVRRGFMTLLAMVEGELTEIKASVADIEARRA